AVAAPGQRRIFCIGSARRSNAGRNGGHCTRIEPGLARGKLGDSHGSYMSRDALELLLTRRSVKAGMLDEPGPNPAQLMTILTAAARVPDHKKLEPWRFLIFEGDARAAFGQLLLSACAAEEKEPPSAVRLEAERTRLLRAPCVVAVVSRVTP